MKLACVIVLYNPTDHEINKIRRYRFIFDDIIVVDNSDNAHNIFSRYKNIKYIPLYKNTGIANAQNIGIYTAIDLGYDWVMTLDQDSDITEKCVDHLKDTIRSRVDSTIAIVAPVFDEITSDDEIEYCQSVISSGSVLSTMVFKEVGGLLTDLFIDLVDNEYCIRIISKGYSIIRCNTAKFTHNISGLKYDNGSYIVSYPALRCYYFIRNALIIIKMYEDNLEYTKEIRRVLYSYMEYVLTSSDCEKKEYLKFAFSDYIRWDETGELRCSIDIY